MLFQRARIAGGLRGNIARERERERERESAFHEYMLRIYSSLIKYANVVARREIPVFCVSGAYSCGHIARYNRHGIRHVRQATTPSR